MEYIRPDYYNEFACIGGKCPDTCCAGWQIVIDEESLENYRNEKSPFANRLHNDIDWKEHTFKQYKNNCCFLSEEHLCDIYSELGEEHLCETCRTYPRHIEEYDGRKEEFLCMSCPVVADLLLGREKKTELILEERQEEENFDENFDFFLFTKLEDSRNYLLKLLQNRECDISIRLAAFLAFGHDFQRRIRNNELCYADELLEKYENTATTTFFAKKKASMEKSMANRQLLSLHYLSTLKKLEIRNENWKKWLDYCERLIKKNSPTEYKRLRRKYKAYLQEQEMLEDWALYQEQIASYFLLNYYCGAVYDERVYAKVKLAILSTYIIEEMVFCAWVGKEKVPDKKIWVKLSYQYSREIEHSEPNLAKLEKEFSVNTQYSLQNLLNGIFCE